MARPQRRRRLDQELQQAVLTAAEQTGRWLDGRFTEEISAVKWEYPTPPKIRDIVDTGRLRASQTRSVDAEGETTFTWPVEYAQQVHDGGVSTRTRRPFPGRPWTRQPLEEVPEQFNRLLDAQLRRLGQ